MRRRHFLLSSLSAAAVIAAAPRHSLAQQQEFFDVITQQMRDLSSQPHVTVKVTLPEPFASLDYDGYRQIQFDPDRAVWKGERFFNLQAFPLGWVHKEPVELSLVEGGVVNALPFGAGDFLYHPPLDRAAFEQAIFPGIAGLKVTYPLNSPDIPDELMIFLGASYFRALGQGSTYGTSARGVAIDTAAGRAEEFPRFNRFYVVPPAPNSDELTIYATLEGPSVTGAYRFVTRPGIDTVMEVTARLFFRHQVTRLGIAPLTSMFLYGGPNRTAFDDYRGRVHDSEGLKIVRASGEEVWRNLNNPAKLAASFYAEESPRAFGLMQRNRNFDHYSDAEARYERRPSVLIEPHEPWGKGQICLIEIPTKLEINDNIVCFWIPETPAQGGSTFEFNYRITWGDITEPNVKYARVVEFRAGEAGVAGGPSPEGERKFVVDFAGPYLDRVTKEESVTPVTTVAHAEIVHSSLIRIPDQGLWRFVIDVRNNDNNPVEISVHLAAGERRLSETWSYQWRPGDDDAH